jgi:hypothetical protein
MLNKLAKRATICWKKRAELGRRRLGNIVSDLKKSVEIRATTRKRWTLLRACSSRSRLTTNILSRRQRAGFDVAFVKKKRKICCRGIPKNSIGMITGSTSIFRACANGFCRSWKKISKLQERRAYTYKDLLDLFDTSVKSFPTRVAMRIERNGKKEQYTFEDVRELTLRAAGFLAEKGIKQNDRVILFSPTICPNGD